MSDIVGSDDEFVGAVTDSSDEEFLVSPNKNQPANNATMYHSGVPPKYLGFSPSRSGCMFSLCQKENFSMDVKSQVPLILKEFPAIFVRFPYQRMKCIFIFVHHMITHSY